MIALYILLGIALLICAILFFPYTIVVVYNGELKTYTKILFFKIPGKGGLVEKLVPALKGANSLLRGDKAEKTEKSGNAEDTEPPKAKKGASKEALDEILEILSLTGILLARFLKRLRVRVARFNIKVATGDPATSAIAYGAVNGAIATLYSLLEDSKNIKNVKKAEINVVCDFFSETPDADIELIFSIRVWQAIHALLSSAITHAKNMVSKDRKRASSKSRKSKNAT